ncbi:NAD(P)H-dependent glycerol-3-phosphate dehydrogenase [Sodalis sp. CWE]|uniref:NAD(P)H-dependent glycerol-3-phosphate dehydrogenase n=1 Tax=Sodalis sp. CWE TaxID=2803816 RepID=UPI001C7CDC52|nr:NAD(P)H-dependent glycerol-3-phosphate dehydrogenase [Sodalis sp. CWE]MBX4180962.1 NAD(P)H-dependent glycerol-3-phosphate dehydrogenase [Sodalis sp. CWE]
MLTKSLMTIVGAGAYGTALAIILASNGRDVLLWGRNPSHMHALKKARCNQMFLPNIQFPPILRLESSLPIALSVSRNILIAVPSHAFGCLLTELKPYLRKDARIVWVTKGLEAGTGRLLQEVAREILGKEIPLAVLSGPTFACELAIGLPTSVVLASTDVTFGIDLHQILHCRNNFRVYNSVDLTGVQIGGIVKNVVAIGTGISDGIGFGASARTNLITQGLIEMSQLGSVMGAKSKTFLGIAGLGDLVLTCTENQSRNRRFGILIGKGATTEEAKKKIGRLVEGYSNAKEILILANRYKIEMPIIEQIYKVLYHNQNAHQAIARLLDCKDNNKNEKKLSF